MNCADVPECFQAIGTHIAICLKHFAIEYACWATRCRDVNAAINILRLGLHYE